MRVSTLLPILFASAALAAPLDARQRGNGRNGRNRGGNNNQAATVTVTVTVSADCSAATGIDNGAGAGNGADDETSSADDVASTAVDTVTSSSVPAETTSAPALDATPGTPTVIKVSGAKGTLEPSAVAESQKKDLTATRIATGVTIKDSDGNCLSVDITEGDFRENLIPIRPKKCDGSNAQNWDFITAGAHNDGRDGGALIVNSDMNGCMNFDDRRAAGDQVIMFSCGGRADGVSGTTNSQLFPITDLSKPYVLAPLNAKGARCFVEKNGRLDNDACDSKNPAANQQFTIGGATAAPPANTVATDASSKTGAPAITTPPPAATTQPTQTTPGVIKVSGAKGVLEPSAVAESQARDDTATRAATGVQIKDSDGNCLAVDITEGDFRENLIPVRPKKCDGSDSQKWDLITAGKHNNGRDKATLIVNSNNGCLNFDDRRAAGDQVIMFSCGGRADGDSETTNSQLFNVPTSGSTALSPLNANGARCFVEKNGRLDNEACDSKNPAANQKFTIVA